MKINKKKVAIRTVAGLGAVGTGLQNFMASVSFLMDMGRMAPGLAQGLAIGLGGAVSGMVNLWMNIDLLEAFFERFTTKPQPNLKGWRKFRYYAGSLVFISTGVLFGLTAFAFGGVGILASLGIAAGILVSVIMMIQELETWLESFDKEGEKITLRAAIAKWWNELSPAKATGLVISIANVLALSLLFALGLTTFLTTLGVPAFPAIVAALVVSFTAGAFTEFYFYNYCLADFCEKIGEQWNNFKKLSTGAKIAGVFSVVVNAVVNAALCYAGVVLFNTLLVSASMSIIPLPVIIVAAAFCGLASLMLGAKFWIRMLAPTEKKAEDAKGAYSQASTNDAGAAMRRTPSQTALPSTTVYAEFSGAKSGDETIALKSAVNDGYGSAEVLATGFTS